MKKTIALLTAVLLLTAWCLPVSAAGTGDGSMTGTFLYNCQQTHAEASYPFTFHENWLLQNSSAYNHQLARMSLRVAMASFGPGPELIKALFDTLGLHYTDSSVCYPDPFYSYEERNSSIGYAIGSKEISGGATLLCVTVRSSEYYDEWGSNFLVGGGAVHEGFAKAAATVQDAVLRYIEDNGIGGDMRVWITGYSRGAAVSNILGHELDLLADSGGIPGLSRDGIYAYCFECPRTVIAEEAETGTGDTNIFNIINDCDVVTKVAPELWGYERYGRDLYLPTETYTGRFAERENEQVRAYADILRRAGLREDPLSAAKLYSALYSFDQQFTDLMADTLALTFGSREDYLAYGEGILSTAVASAISQTKGQPKRSVWEMLLGEETADIWPWFAMGLDAAVLPVAIAHYPELCLSWMESLPGESGFCEPVSRRLAVNGGAVTVLKENGEPFSEDGRVFRDGETEIYLLPCDAAFTVLVEEGEKESSWTLDRTGAGEQENVQCSWERNGGTLMLTLKAEGSAQALPGDVNGDGAVNTLDALQVLLFDARLETPYACRCGLGDVDRNGLINSVDALRILMYDAGLLPEIG